MFYSNYITTRELDFFETAELLECDIMSKKYPIDNKSFYDLLSKNKDFFDYELEIEKKEEQTQQKWRSNEKDLIKLIQFILQNKWLLEHEKKYLRDFLEAIQKWIVGKDTIRKARNYLDDNKDLSNIAWLVIGLQPLIPKEYIEYSTTPENRKKDQQNIQVILSEYFLS